jgi:hypothetical protein
MERLAGQKTAFENNFTEQVIRPSVIIRRDSQSDRSEKGDAVCLMLMSIYRTLKLRGHKLLLEELSADN